MEDALDLVSLGSVASEDTTVAQDEDDYNIDLDVLEEGIGRPVLLRHPVLFGLPSLVPLDEGFMETLASECDWRMYGRFMTAMTRLKTGSVTWQEAAAKIEEALRPDPALLSSFKNSCPILFIIVNLSKFYLYCIKKMTSIQTIFEDIDKTWVRRKRQLNTMTIVRVLHECAIRERGLQHVLHCNNIKVSAAAICKSRQKIPAGSFRRFSKDLQSQQTGRSIYAIDGSKVHLPPSFKDFGFKTRTNGKQVSRPAKRPLCMLSSMVNVQTKTCLDFRVTSHFDERRAAIKLLDSAKARDVILFDRGYYSSDLIKALKKRNLDFVFRLKCDAFRGVKEFTKSSKKTLIVCIAGYCCQLVKYVIDGRDYVCLTSLSGDSQDMQGLYKMRWKVEEHFKRLKTYLNADKTRCRTVKTFYQDIEMRVFLDTLSLRISPAVQCKSNVQCLDTLFTSLSHVFTKPLSFFAYETNIFPLIRCPTTRKVI